MSGFNEEMPPWAWQVGESLPREWTCCRYHGHGGLEWMETISRGSTRFGKLFKRFRGFQGTQRGFGVLFPTPGRVPWAQSLCICLVSVYGSDGASAPPWTLQSSLGISFEVLNMSPVLARCDSLSWSWSTLCPVPLQQLPVHLQIVLSVLSSLSGSGKPFPCILSLHPLSQVLLPCFLEPLQALEVHK